MHAFVRRLGIYNERIELRNPPESTSSFLIFFHFFPASLTMLSSTSLSLDASTSARKWPLGFLRRAEGESNSTYTTQQWTT